MAQCRKCKHFKGIGRLPFIRWCERLKGWYWYDDYCRNFVYDDKEFDDELDEYLFKNHQVKSGCCSSVENLKYQIAREVAERMIEEFDIDIQYVSQEERRKKMDEMYGINMIQKNPLNQ